MATLSGAALQQVRAVAIAQKQKQKDEAHKAAAAQKQKQKDEAHKAAAALVADLRREKKAETLRNGLSGAALQQERAIAKEVAQKQKQNDEAPAVVADRREQKAATLKAKFTRK